MKNEMDEIPTPETDALYNPENEWTGLVMRLKMRDLERRLTIAREALERIHAFPYHPHVCEFARITLTLTAPKI